ncbi:MAG: cystathionine gamma-synthase [Candidatus Marinimicrobia bacterium]|nr:cystathionine gamma-synthase [Candidatus Neomarinimicrobiota bacterium]|tara:strand:+ start:4457 stop:5656 length:1200 start_codon:yes stop_codon:yes gene_type:complete
MKDGKSLSKNNKKHFNTKVIHEGQKPEKPYGAVSLPIYQTSTFQQEEFGEYLFDYSRADNPTRQNLEKNIASLEGGIGAVAYSSGMAAISSICQMFKTGDEFIFTNNVYGGTYRLMEKIMDRFDLKVKWVDTSNIEDVENAISSKTKMIFIETPTNPMMRLSDIEKISLLAKKHQIVLAVDNTFMSPFFQRPIELGADIVMHSSTKYIGGHSDIIGGLVIVNDDEKILEDLRFIQMSVGAVPGPFDCWLTQRSIKTLSVRMQRHNENAIELANLLDDSNYVKNVYYPGLQSHPHYELAKKQHSDPNGAHGFGGMISFSLSNRSDAKKFVKNLTIFTLAESLGGVESLVCHPASMTHASMPRELREKIGISEGFLRLSVGIEDISDLKHDIENALSAISS